MGDSSQNRASPWTSGSCSRASGDDQRLVDTQAEVQALLRLAPAELFDAGPVAASRRLKNQGVSTVVL